MTWRDIQGWFNFQDVYKQIAEDAKPGQTIVELGVWRGCSLAFLAEELFLRDKQGVKLFGVDNFVGGNDTPQVYAGIKQGMKKSVLDECRENLTGCGVMHMVTLIQDDTAMAASAFKDGSVDFLFIDSNHTPEVLRIELNAWLPKMRRPSWIGGHDIHGTRLREAVIEFFPNFKIEGACWTQRIV